MLYDFWAPGGNKAHPGVIIYYKKKTKQSFKTLIVPYNKTGYLFFQNRVKYTFA